MAKFKINKTQFKDLAPENITEILKDMLRIARGHLPIVNGSNVKDAIDYIKDNIDSDEITSSEREYFNKSYPFVNKKAMEMADKRYTPLSKGKKFAMATTGVLGLTTLGVAAINIANHVEQDERAIDLDENIEELKEEIINEEEKTIIELNDEILGNLYNETVVDPAVEFMEGMAKMGVDMTPNDAQSLIYGSMLNSNEEISEEIQRSIASMKTPISQLLLEDFQQTSYLALTQATERAVDFVDIFGEEYGEWANKSWDTIIAAQNNPSDENIREFADFYKDVVENYEKYNNGNSFATFFVMNSIASPLQPGFGIHEKVDGYGINNDLISKYDSLTQASRNAIYKSLYVTNTYNADVDANLDFINDTENLQKTFNLSEELAKQFKFTANYKNIPRENGKAFVGDNAAEDIANKYRNFTVFASKGIVSGKLNSENFNASELFGNESQANLVNETIKAYEDGDLEKWNEIYENFSLEVKSDRYNNPGLATFMFNLADDAHRNSDMKLADDLIEIIVGQNAQRDIENKILIDDIHSFEEYERILIEQGMPKIADDQELGNEYSDASQEQDWNNEGILSEMDLEQNAYNMMLGELGAIKEDNVNYDFKWQLYDADGNKVDKEEDATYRYSEKFNYRIDIQDENHISKYQAILNEYSEESSKEKINRSEWINERIAEKTKDLEVTELEDIGDFFRKLNGISAGNIGLGGAVLGADGNYYIDSGKVVDLGAPEESVTIDMLSEEELNKKIDDAKRPFEEQAKKELEEDPIEIVVDTDGNVVDKEEHEKNPPLKEENKVSEEQGEFVDDVLTEEQKQQNQDAVDKGHITEEERQELEENNEVILDDFDWDKELSPEEIEEWWNNNFDKIVDEDLTTGNNDNSVDEVQKEETDIGNSINEVQKDQTNNNHSEGTIGESVTNQNRLQDLINNGASDDEIANFLVTDENYLLDMSDFIEVDGMIFYKSGVTGYYESIDILKELASYTGSVQTENVEEKLVDEHSVPLEDLGNPNEVVGSTSSISTFAMPVEHEIVEVEDSVFIEEESNSDTLEQTEVVEVEQFMDGQIETDTNVDEQAVQYQAETDMVVDEQAVQAEANRVAAEQVAQAEADRIAAEQAAQAEADRIASEQAAQQRAADIARLEAEREALAAQAAPQEEAEKTM